MTLAQRSVSVASASAPASMKIQRQYGLQFYVNATQAGIVPGIRLQFGQDPIVLSAFSSR